MNDTNGKISIDTRVKVLMWIIGGISIFMIGALGYINGKTDKTSETFNHNVTEIREDIVRLETNICWLVSKEGGECVRKQ